MTARNAASNREPGGGPGDGPGGGPDRAMIDYYDQTWGDYKLLWLNRDNLAVHFGFHDETTRGHRDALKNMNRALADRVAIQPGERVLDAGCGVGGSCLWLVEERGAEAVGITLVASQLRRALRYVAERGLSERVRFQIADFTATGFPDASFDVVWSIEALCHAADKAAFYREAARVLRPGGRIVVAEYIRVDRPVDPTSERLLRDWFDGWAIPDIGTRAEHLSYLAEAGFTDARIEDITAHTRPSLRRLWRMAYFTFPLAVLARLTRIRTAVQHANVIGSVRQYQALRRDVWFYSIITATKPPTHCWSPEAE